jgi:ribosomal protein S18 acetylase RimI-like enzyme
MPLIIRFCDSNDAGLIADMSRQTFLETFAAANTKENMNKFLEEQFSREMLMKEVEAPGNIFLLAMLDNEPVGYVRMRESPRIKALGNATAIEVARIYAVQNSIGKGIGKALMEKCIAIAKEKDKQVIWLGVWEQNQRAIDFYIKWGFEKFGEHEFVLGDDVQTDWLLKKNLS